MPIKQLINKSYQFHYPKFVFGSWSHCCYCGEIAQCKDHVIPLSYVSSSQRRNIPQWNYCPQTPCCRDCNGKLYNKYFQSFYDRCLFVSNKLSKKAIKCSATWEENEVLDLGYGLQKYIKAKQAEKSLFYERTSWFLSDRFLENL